jgi:actin-related protein
MIIIDNGTVKIKIGRSGVDYPSVIIDTVSGYPHAISDNAASPPKKIYFGKELVGKLQKFWTISSRIRLIFGIVP